MEEIKGYSLPKFNCKIVSLSEIDDLKIEKITIDGSLLFPDKKILMCDYDNPLMYVDNFFYQNAFCVDQTYYKLHNEEIDELVVRICKNTKESSIKIDDSVLITEKVLDAILDNPNLQEITLGSREDKFVLTEDIFKKFEGTHITSIITYDVSPELKDNFNPLIGYNLRRTLIGFDTYDSLQNSDNVFLNNSLNEEEISNLKYVKKNANIRFSFNDYKNIFRCINTLREVGHTGKITVCIDDKNLLNDYIFYNLDDISHSEDIFISLSGSVHSLTTYMKYEKKLLDLIMPAINLSPFEKYLFAYNVVKNFKKYKENENDRTSARDLYQIFDNEFMVCVAYSKLLGDLLEKLGIENCEDSVSVDIGFDNIPNEEKPLPDFIYDEKTGELKSFETESVGHSRRRVHLVDPKYDIDGYYYADPTWDNEMEHDTYNYALMTEEEYIGLDRYNYYNIYGVSELFFTHSLEEFYTKINIYLDKNRKKDESDVISSLLFCFKKIDSDFYIFMCNKYPDISKNNKKFTKEEIQEILLDIGERIVQKNDHVIDGNLFKAGITALYRDAYGFSGEELENQVNEIMEYNKKRHLKCFPMRYKVDKDNNSLVILNVNNKFDLDEVPKLDI